MHVVQGASGWVEVICGPMFSGKSEELIRRLRRATIARQTVQAFKPRVDDRYSASHVVSHSQLAFDATPVESTRALLAAMRPETRVVGIDEVQFFDPGIVEAAQRMADRGIRVILAGLDQDYTGKPFDPVPELLAIAEYITKTLAICTVCGSPAGRTQRLVASTTRVVVGAAEAYEARCRHCHSGRGEPRTAPLFDDSPLLALADEKPAKT